ncbi:thioredoxin-like protein [Sistotremastrum niveocremeum HHB9708]|uniref:Thioredoxin-like protein n=1 Tax=Sistotremastrum niveocremeum HHB9708 TaxID=1314777 RepID=A0A164ZF61_9AGAM|nr:thioredoxin-like protein [Sistotremastrum niveocremeum HHB9708]
MTKESVGPNVGAEDKQDAGNTLSFSCYAHDMTQTDDAPLRPPTPEVDEKVQAAVDKLVSAEPSGEDGDSDAELLEGLAADDDFDFGPLRERRMEELKEEMSKIRDMRESDHGKYTEVFDEKEVVKLSANESRCVIHFYHRDFTRCKIMDKHLEARLSGHLFYSLSDQQNVPWLVEKLAIKVLPCVICFIRGVSKHRFTGFEEFGNSDAFDTATLELRLTLCGVIEKPQARSGASRVVQSRGIRGPKEDEDDSDFDL